MHFRPGDIPEGDPDLGGPVDWEDNWQSLELAWRGYALGFCRSGARSLSALDSRASQQLQRLSADSSMLSALQRIIDWCYRRPMDGDDARSRGLGASRGCVLWIPILIALYAMLGIAMTKWWWTR